MREDVVRLSTRPVFGLAKSQKAASPEGASAPTGDVGDRREANATKRSLGGSRPIVAPAPARFGGQVTGPQTVLRLSDRDRDRSHVRARGTRAWPASPGLLAGPGR